MNRNIIIYENKFSYNMFRFDASVARDRSTGANDKWNRER